MYLCLCVNAHSGLVCAVFPFGHCETRYYHSDGYKPHQTHMQKHTHTHFTVRLTCHQWYSIKGASAKMKQPTLLKRHFVKQMTLPRERRSAVDQSGFKLPLEEKKKRKEKTG